MSAASIFRAASRTRLTARPATVVRRPCRALSPRTAVKSFATTARTTKDHDPHDPHHEESFEEFTARYDDPGNGVCGAQWVMDGPRAA
jgi:cytochrome c oxidase subunit 5a